MRELGVNRGRDVVNITFDLCGRAVGVLHSLVNRAIELRNLDEYGVRARSQDPGTAAGRRT